MFYNNRILLGLVIITISFTIGCSITEDNTGFDQVPMIYWKDTSYYVQDINHTRVDKDELKNKIGEIKAVVDNTKKPRLNGNANIFKKGCNIYTLKDKKESEAIVIEYNDVYYMAITK